MSNAMSKPNALNMPQAGGARKTLCALAGFTVVVILVGIYFSAQQASPLPRSDYEGQASAGQPAAAVRPTAAQPTAQHLRADGALGSGEPFVDFGKISMAAGKVSSGYWIKNASATPLTLTNISTSCMCTKATLIIQSARKKGSFGMPGHGPAVDIEERLAPGQLAKVEVVFDPAAHGPAGIGKTERIVTIRNSAGRSLDLAFSAYVTP